VSRASAVLERVAAATIDGAAALTNDGGWPHANDPPPAASATPTNCAIRLTALLTPEASPSSTEPMLESTDAVSGATSAANETPSTAIGPITPNVSDEA